MAVASSDQRTRAKKLLNQFSARKLAAAFAFLQYLDATDEWDATKSVLADKRAVRQVKQSRADWKHGKHKAFVQWKSGTA